MEQDSAKRYFKKLNTTIEGLNKVDGFAQQFQRLLNRSELEFYQKERREKRIFDDSFMDEVENAIPVIDKLTRNPRETLKKVSHVVAVERAKRIDSDTIRHLAAHSQNIKEIDRNGNVIPAKVLTSYYDQDLGTYENRFLMSLVNKLYSFIEIRYNLIIEKMTTEYANFLKVNSAVEWQDTSIEYDITLNIRRKIEDDDYGVKNQKLLDRMTEVRKSITNFKMSNFMREMKKFPPVRSPIMMTNILQKNVDFHQCYNLWVTLDRVDRVGYETDIFDRDALYETEYQEQVKNAMMVLYATVSNSQIEDLDFSQPMNYLREKKPKMFERIDQDEYMSAGEYLLDDQRFNQYFLDKIRDVNQQRYQTLRDAGIEEDESIRIVFQRLQEIADAAFKDFMDHHFKPQDIEDVRERVKMQRKVLNLYDEIEELKSDNIKEFNTNKALVQLNLKNFLDDLREVQEQERREQRELEEKRREERLAELDAKAREKVLKQEKLEAARKVLEDARKERERKEKQAKKKR